MKYLIKKALFSAFIFLALLAILKGKAYAYANVGIMPYKIISSHGERYSYLAGSIPLIVSSDLSGDGIRIIRNSDLASYAKKNNINFSTKNFLKLSGHFKADYLIFGRIVKIGNVFIIQTNIFNVAGRRVVYRSSIQAAGAKFIIGDIDKLSGALKKKIVSLQAAEVFPVKKQASQTANAAPEVKSSIFIKRFTQNGGGLIKTASKKYVIQAISAGRFLPKGIQAVVATRHRVILYKLALNGEMTKLTQYKLSTRSNVIYLGFYKISGNYKAIVLTKAKLGIITSYLLVYRNGRLVKLTKNYNLFLRAMNLPGLGNVIVGQEPVSVATSGRYFNDYVIGQNSYPIGQFGGDTYVYKFDNNTGSLTRTKKLPLYSGITLYGTVYGNIKGNGKNYLVALSNSGNLMVINNKGRTIYTGSKTYGGSSSQVRVPSFGGVRSSTYSGGLIYNVPAQVDEFYHKGGYGIIVLKNYRQAAFLHNLNYYTKSSVFGLAWNKIGFYPLWEIKPVAGYSAGFSVFEEGKNVYLADGIVENPGSALTTPKSYIAIYKIARSDSH